MPADGAVAMPSKISSFDTRTDLPDPAPAGQGFAPSPLIDSGDPRQLARSLRTWRTLRRIKQDHAGTLLRVSQATISRWENGQATPDADEAQRLRTLMAARLDSAADQVLARLVRQSAQPVHLVCDLTHRLLALSPGREAQFHVPASTLMGASLWRYATEDIVRAESQLADHGWYGPSPPAIAFSTAGRDSDALSILPCHMRWVRLQLSDGSFVRLVETLGDAPAPHAAGNAANQSAMADSASNWR